MEIGRNNPCPCGSGIKYKKCCLNKPTWDQMPPEFRHAMFSNPYEDNLGRLIGRPFISANSQDKKARAVGGRVYFRPIEESFHEFIIEHLKIVLGIEWGMREQAKPHDEQHIIVKWIHELGEFMRVNRTDVNKVKDNLWSMEPTGNVQALLSFAYDIYNLKHCSSLPNKILRKLRDPSTFQSTKYEVTVASFFARAGFDIEWIFDKTQRRAEFIATHRVTKEKIVVEAKSRHRSGVLHEMGEEKSRELLKAEVKGLFDKALTQGTDALPFMIFIDLNLPMTPEIPPFSKRWFQELKEMIAQYPNPTAENPDVFNVLFITNFSWHYYRNESGMVPGEDLAIIPLFAKYPLLDRGTIDLMRRSVDQYGMVPHDV